MAGAILTTDRAGTVFFAVAAIALTALSLHGLLVRPRLTADPRGVRIRTATGKHDLHWPEVTTRVRTTRRLGRTTETLEIESGEQLFVFGWLELGADPRDVLDTLTALRP
ncbi:PH domain-containing protein [Amycolatopsis granulosa]|uniref:PH domain-containing protein n=1 Tax=Amycolatopsis granulosa TaxID=185684 RepID=UPI00312CB24C|nr:hypothetical protein [Amycolatopsis granulosa]